MENKHAEIGFEGETHGSKKKKKSAGVLADVKLALICTQGGAGRHTLVVNMGYAPLPVAITTTHLNNKNNEYKHFFK